MHTVIQRKYFDFTDQKLVAQFKYSNKQTNKMMFIKSLLIATIATSAVAFGPASLARPTMSRLSMNAEGLAGETGPLGYFDPLGKFCTY
jgi:hypothetical protein